MDETVRFSDDWSGVVHNFINSEGTPPTSFVRYGCEHQWHKKDFQSKNPLPSTKQQLDQAKTPTKRQTLLIQKEPHQPHLSGMVVSINGIRKTFRARIHCHQPTTARSGKDTNQKTMQDAFTTTAATTTARVTTTVGVWKQE